MISFQDVFTREVSADKCITSLTESVPVNVLELQPEFLYQEQQLSATILEAAVQNCPLKQLFKNISQFSGNHQ